jgi:hypothetical protein
MPLRLFCGITLLATLASLPLHAEKEEQTPLILAVHDAPIPFLGSDNRTHLVYELWITNFSSSDITLDKVEVLSNGAPVATLDHAEIAKRLQPAGLREPVDSLPKSVHALLFLHITLPAGAATPKQLTHRISGTAKGAPPGHEHFTEISSATAVDNQSVAIIHPPLSGTGYISADSCCDSSRHTRAAMPVNGRVWISQRYAVDWEQLDSKSRIYNGPREKLESYTIFGKPVLAVADATVVSAIDDLPEQIPGKYPTNISLAEADGNSVILDLGSNRYAVYAHMQPKSIRVHRGDKVHAGQVIGLVGNTGNSVAPHLHFQVMSAPSSFTANGLPYEIEGFEVTAKSPGTEAFDAAEANGTQLAIRAVTPMRLVERGLPLDQQIISFPSK